MEIDLINSVLNDKTFNFNYKLEEGMILAVLGKNSSGKTQLFDKIYKKMDKHSVFYLKQDYKYDLFNINILEDIKYEKRPINTKKIDELLKIFNIDSDKLKNNYLELSEGEIKKVLLIKLFVGNYKVILMDDPTNGLDEDSTLKLVTQLKREKRKGRIILFSSQNSEFINQVADEVVLLNSKFISVHSTYDVLSNSETLNELGISMPEIIKFRLIAEGRNIKLGKSKSVNDLIKSIYRKSNEIRSKY